ncbi:AAA family ATPase, partial [Candidatus Nomurabacteria bacterium]|nr:AAA family ATPase [Candidatus Nomurabacteria bacterium]
MKTNPANEAQIKIYAKLLRIPTFSDYDELLNQMQPEENFEDLLLDLMRKEVAQRQENQNKRRVKAAGFPYHKSLDNLEVDRYKEKITQNFISELSSCQFISERKNIIMIGPPGRGKTHIAIGLGMKACSLGKRVCFKNVMS